MELQGPGRASAPGWLCPLKRGARRARIVSNALHPGSPRGSSPCLPPLPPRPAPTHRRWPLQNRPGRAGRVCHGASARQAQGKACASATAGCRRAQGAGASAQPRVKWAPALLPPCSCPSAACRGTGCHQPLWYSGLHSDAHHAVRVWRRRRNQAGCMQGRAVRGRGCGVGLGVAHARGGLERPTRTANQRTHLSPNGWAQGPRTQ